MVDGEVKTFPQEVEYSCDKDYATVPSAEKVLTCNGGTGQFEPSLPECLRGKSLCVIADIFLIKIVSLVLKHFLIYSCFE